MNKPILFFDYTIFSDNLGDISFHGKNVVSTLNANSFNIAQQNHNFKQALIESDYLLPDGISIVLATKLLTGKSINKIAGADIFYHLVNKLNESRKRCFFLGSTEDTLNKIRRRLSEEYPNIQAASYSPPFRHRFSDDENKTMLEKINTFYPHVLFVGMTAPKQEIWVHKHKCEINANIICSIGAVFDFYAGTIRRAPSWMIRMGLEWFYRLIKEPRRLGKRYLIGNLIFVCFVIKEKFKLLHMSIIKQALSCF